MTRQLSADAVRIGHHVVLAAIVYYRRPKPDTETLESAG
jgi:hypothetical protein